MSSSRSFRKTLLSASVASVLGLSASGAVNATEYVFNFTGAFTMINASGTLVQNNPSPYVYYGYQHNWYGRRTPISGTITYDDTAGTGTMTINGFLFFGDGPANAAQAYDVSIRYIGDGNCTSDDPDLGCQPGNLLLGNMLFNWNNSSPDYPVNMVWDASGLLTALSGGVSVGTVISGTGATPWTDGRLALANYKLGPSPLAVTTPNTTPNGCSPNCGDVNPSGILPLNFADTIGGSPIIGTSFGGFSPNFDFMTLTVECIDGTCNNTRPTLFTKMPKPSATDIDPGAKLVFSFTQKMNTASVSSAFTLKDSGGTTVPGTLVENTNTPGSASNFTFTPSSPLADGFTYTATVTTTAQGVNGRALAANESWSFTVGTPAPAGACTAVPQAPVGSNFTMLNPSGETFPEGTNDIVYTIVDVTNSANLNDDEADTNFNMTIASARPQPFFGYTWSAHHVRVFGPGTYTFDTTCTVADIMGGLSANCGRPLPTGQTERYLTMTVGADQVGAHMLFDWGQNDPTTPCGKANCNIDVVNVWDKNAVWNTNPRNQTPPPPAKVNKLFDGETWAGPAGLTVNPATTWALVSRDVDGDGFNGAKMVDGAFIGYSANFNLSATSTCLPGDPTPITVDASNSFPSSGCSISRNPADVSILGKAEWLLVGGFLAWLGAVRRRFRRQTQS